MPRRSREGGNPGYPAMCATDQMDPRPRLHESRPFAEVTLCACLRCKSSASAVHYDHTGAVGMWAPSEFPPGQALRQPAPLFKKLDASVIEEEYARL